MPVKHQSAKKYIVLSIAVGYQGLNLATTNVQTFFEILSSGIIFVDLNYEVKKTEQQLYCLHNI